ncbi:TorF family putative porin [Roseateles sp.]|uniref:TorF family putative porin n=1 Tax=Roseateles sp. TaxID=1971397 RepID=UPI00326521A0
MPPARPARLALLTVLLLAGPGAARADVGATLSLQSDARERGLSYSGNRPGAQLGLAWDGEGGWYAGASLTHARFERRGGASLRAYGGRVVELRPGLNAELGLLAHRFENVSSYDFVETYAALLGERWNLRLYASPDYYGNGQRSLYGEFNLHWPLAQGIAAIGHIGLLHGWGRSSVVYGGPQDTARVDVRAGASLQWGAGSEMQLVWVAASRGGPYIWINATRRSTAVLSLTTAF